MPQIFTNPSALEEKIDDVSLSNKQLIEAKRIKKKLDNYQKKKQGKIIAYVGRFGSGKSATLKQIEQLYDQSKAKCKPRWLSFEAWRYADRSKLWDGFVIEVAKKLKGNSGEQKTKNTIDGIVGLGGWVYKHPLPTTIVISLLWLVVSVALWLGLHGRTDLISILVKDLLQYAIPVFFGLLAIAGVTTLFRQTTSPLTRVEELEKLLDKSLRKLKEPLIVVVEDIDRAGDEGLVFLETLRSFIDKPRKKPFKYPIIVIAPQDNTYMSVLNEDKIKGIERGIKIYDSVMYYSSSTIQSGDTTQLLAEAGIEPEYCEKVIKVMSKILRLYKSHLSLRMLKFIFREAEEFAESQDGIDAALAIFIVLMRYVKVDSGTIQDVFRGRRGMFIKSSMSTNEAKQNAIHLIYDQLLLISGIEPSGDVPMYVSYDNIKEEIIGLYKEYDSSKPTERAGYYITIHEKYRGLLG